MINNDTQLLAEAYRGVDRRDVADRFKDLASWEDDRQEDPFGAAGIQSTDMIESLRDLIRSGEVGDDEITYNRLQELKGDIDNILATKQKYGHKTESDAQQLKYAERSARRKREGADDTF
tara:strand:- start:44696 stop:45055 length:360 start_codon:yes stop_codon:yes gene_type:complete